MKLSFTTLGCPEWDLDTIIRSAAEYGFDAIDFRGVGTEMNIYKLSAFSDSAQSTKKQIQAAGLRVSCFSSSVQLVSIEKFGDYLAEIEAYAKLCALFGTRYIRVFGGKIGDRDRAEALQAMVMHAERMGKIAKEYGAKLLLETHDDWTACGEVKRFMEQVDTEAYGVLWDVHHPYRMLGERPETTWEALGEWIDYVHVKDSLLTPDNPRGYQYCLLGEGDVPLRNIIEVLERNGYNGYYTLEWEKKWHPDIEEPNVVFPHYVQKMRGMEQEL
ncbi:sugar phosphate isomerase/epimerase [Paenibacillus filicis]|uniref:Sugar phosphate isomerase/epimerase n=1 Tax=Paenibacillus gyeongsangnamensis TaxID=3388067 RepID=A0ABT4QBA9_9BACL|nr:sugar phosphate isomerase/epimerase family protein [Paenibacillus filicis]MCZ8514170.1 sugar phosphate isomerase/epimerase [Paenibacillus filicis]